MLAVKYEEKKSGKSRRKQSVSKFDKCQVIKLDQGRKTNNLTAVKTK